MLRCVVQAAMPAAMLVAAMFVTTGPAGGGDDPPAEPRTRQPDGQIKVEGAPSFEGENEFLFQTLNNIPTYQAPQVGVSIFGEDEGMFRYRIQNDGVVTDRYRLSGARNNSIFRVKYFKLGGQDITKDVKKGKFKTKSLDPEQKQNFRIALTLKQDQVAHFFPLTATSVKDGGAIDVVTFGRKGPA